MRSPSCVALLSVLQAHGLTYALLERLASYCQQEKTGAFILHTHEGQIMAYEEHHKSRVALLETPQEWPARKKGAL
jgi:hypothetical protein